MRMQRTKQKRQGNGAGFALILIAALLFGFMAAPLNTAEADGTYSLRVNVRTNVVTVYENGAPVRAMLCSTGEATPKSGTYSLGTKYRWHALYGNVYGQYTCRITGHILFHSVPYTKNGDPSSLKPGAFDLLGTPASEGCVRLMVRDAKWIYENCPIGETKVTFYSGNEPDPLTPARYQISGLPGTFAGWDPTDDDPGSPWNTAGDYFGAAYDASYYIRHNPDVRAAFSDDAVALKLHWVRYGIPERRRAAKAFDITVYQANYPDLQSLCGTDPYAYVKHYLNTGRAEGRIAELRIGTEVYGDGSLITGPSGTLYRVYHEYTGEHLYTMSPEETASLIRGDWNYEGFAWTSPPAELSETPVYRLYDALSGDHHYTTDENERKTLIADGWRDEGIGWYSNESEAGVPLYRLFNPYKTGTGKHIYTKSAVERNDLVSRGWIYEGVGWYGM